MVKGPNRARKFGKFSGRDRTTNTPRAIYVRDCAPSKRRSQEETRDNESGPRLPQRLICHNFIMCGRYRLSRRKQILEEHFDSVSGEEDWTPRYNIAPTQPVPIIRQHPKEPVREMSLVRWGLIPSWSQDSSTAAKMINARSETAATLPAFRDAMKSRRCIIPADGFYEWEKKGKTKQPYIRKKQNCPTILTDGGASFCAYFN